jgi:hypothetical protein
VCLLSVLIIFVVVTVSYIHDWVFSTLRFRNLLSVTDLLHLKVNTIFPYVYLILVMWFNFIYFHWSLYILYKFKGNKPEQIPMRVNRIMYTIFMLSNYHIITRLNTSWDHISINILIYQNHVYHSQTILCFSWQ